MPLEHNGRLKPLLVPGILSNPLWLTFTVQAATSLTIFMTCFGVSLSWNQRKNLSNSFDIPSKSMHFQVCMYNYLMTWHLLSHHTIHLSLAPVLWFQSFHSISGFLGGFFPFFLFIFLFFGYNGASSQPMFIWCLTDLEKNWITLLQSNSATLQSFNWRSLLKIMTLGWLVSALWWI